PSSLYRAGVERGEWDDDPRQRAALQALDRMHGELLQPPRTGLLARLRGQAAPAPRGLYLWGGVGRGKTFLVDLFHRARPLPERRGAARAGAAGGAPARSSPHFRRFMRSVHERRRAPPGVRAPLATIVRGWPRRLRVLVLDEVF